MKTIFSHGKVIAKGANDGVSLIRSGQEISFVPNAKAELGTNVLSEITECPKDSDDNITTSGPYRSSVSCGSLPGRPSVTVITKPDGGSPATISHAITTEQESPPPEKEVEDCIEEGLILATVGGLYLIIPGESYLQDTTIKFLGTNLDAKCVVTNIGRLDKFNSRYSSCMPAKWDFQERVRKYIIGQIYNIQMSCPFIHEQVEFYSGYYKDAVKTPHYGYQLVATKFWSIAKLAGCALDLGQSWFSYGAMFATEVDRDFILENTIGFDANSYVINRSSIRIRQLNVQSSCELDPVYTSNDPHTRLTEELNHERFCYAMIDEVKAYEAARELAQSYANRMAEGKFVSHVDAQDPKTLEDRAASLGLVYELIYEMLGTVPDPGLPNPIENKDQVCDDLFQLWLGRDDEHTKMTSSLYFRTGFGLAQANTGEWYGCGILLTLEEDEVPDYTYYQVSLPNPPEVTVVDNSPLFNDMYAAGNTFRAFSQYPKMINVINSNAARWWYGGLTGLQLIAFIKENGAYGLSSPELSFLEDGTVDPNSIDRAYITNDKICEWPIDILTSGALIRPDQASKDPSIFYIQYDADHSRSVYLKITSAEEELGDIATDTSPTGDYHRSSVLPNEGEEDLEATGTPPGKVELYVGNTLIDSTEHFGQGMFTNPFQAITVGSVFHTSTGNTVVTYTLSKTLKSTHYEWEANYPEVHELYYWMSLSLYCAVVDPVGARVARWDLGGTNPTLGNIPFYEYTYHVFTPLEQTFDFEHQFMGEIKKGSVEVRATVDGYPIYLVDDETGGLYEQPNQHPEQETVLAGSSIDYDLGLVSFSFDTVWPDIHEDILLSADVEEFELYNPFKVYAEHVGYLGKNSYSYELRPFQSLGLEGLGCRFPEATITSDGRYVVFSCYPVYFIGTRNTRLNIGDDLPDTDFYDITIEGKGSRMQVTVFDLNYIEAEKPKRISKPMFLTNDVGYTDTVVLN